MDTFLQNSTILVKLWWFFRINVINISKTRLTCFSIFLSTPLCWPLKLLASTHFSSLLVIHIDSKSKDKNGSFSVSTPSSYPSVCTLLSLRGKMILYIFLPWGHLSSNFAWIQCVHWFITHSLARLFLPLIAHYLSLV